MKNTILLLPVTCFIFIIQSCSKSESSGTATPPVTAGMPASSALIITLNKSQILADGFEEAIITVKDSVNADVTNSSSISVNNAPLTGNKFYTSVTGSYQVKATKNGITSTPVTLTASDPGPSLFTQKILAESFSGTWCGICPGTIIPLENYTSTHPNVISVGIHGPSGSNDPFQYIYDPQLRTTFGIAGVPTVLLNRDSYWADTSGVALNQLAQKRAPLGISFETSISGNTINVSVKVKFDVTTAIPLKIVVMLAEDNIKYNQANYGHFGLPNPIVNFNHRNVLRSAATDIFGDAIATNQSIKGNTWQKDYTLNAAGYIAANCRIIAFVLYGDNTMNKKGVLNTQIVTAGQNKNFD